MAVVEGAYTSVEEVAALRAKGAFTDTTLPTPAQVERIILLVAYEIDSVLSKNFTLPVLPSDTINFRRLTQINTEGAVASIIDAANAGVNVRDNMLANPFRDRYTALLRSLESRDALTGR